MSVGIGLLSAASSLLILSGDGELRSDWDELGRTRDRTVTCCLLYTSDAADE